MAASLDRLPPLWVGGVVCLLLLAVMAGLRLWILPHRIAPVAYGIPLVICALWQNRRLLWTLAAAFAVVTVVEVWSVLPRYTMVPELHTAEYQLGATVAMLLELVVVAVVLHVLIGFREAREEHRRVLELRNAELQTANKEAAIREDEVARQNEELQSQTEELERQGEELRIANEELARREKMLEALLDLSRSLSTHLSREQTLSRICDALRQLVDGDASAAAILLRDKGRLRVLCHSGFGPGGIEEEILWPEKSFASLIIEQGRTGYVEDLEQRPDLIVPQPQGAERIRSVLAAPVRVRERSIGTLEIYSSERRGWNESQIAMIESLAAQASISLDAARLFDEIESQRSRFEAVIRTLPIGILVCEDQECGMVRGNPAAAAMYAVSTDANFSPIAPASERINRSVHRQGRAIDLDEHPLLRAVLQGERVEPEEVEVLFPGGRKLTLLVSCAPTYDAQMRITGAVCGFVDISRLKALEQELERRRREAEEASFRKSRFLAAVSHDIRTPANAIGLLAEIIRRSANNPAMVHEIPSLAIELEGSSRTLVDLVTDVLDITRFDSGKLELHETEFCLGSIMSEECRQLQSLAQQKALMFECEPPDPGICVRADRVKLARVLGNLIGNAVKFTDSGGVRVSAALLEDGRPEIAVSDTGIGIAQEHRARIFDEFYQLRVPNRDLAHGSGLGLAICHRLVEAMGGEILVESDVGRGSTFRVRLPAAAVAPRMRQEPLPAPVPQDPQAENGLSGIRILLVEDHAGTRRAMARMLAGHGAAVIEAEDGQGALRQLAASNPHVILLDLMLPDMDGVEVLRRIENGGRPATLRSVLVLTGDISESHANQARQHGADDIIRKPIEMKSLVSILRRTAGA
jgi:signal transduction histidine kinase/CheY-like chemotaxis protein